jgi:hypothetical protein
VLLAFGICFFVSALGKKKTKKKVKVERSHDVLGVDVAAGRHLGHDFCHG